jgi:DNA (cytosine-5)-methyltransferase 1
VVFETVCTDLESEGYEVQPFIIPAAGVGAPHRRERVWIIATLVNTQHNGSPATTQRRSFKETSNHNEEGQNKTSESEGTSGRERHENLENSRRTLRQGTELQGKNEDEVGEGYANQHQRSGSPSESNVANAKGERTRENDEGLRSRTSGVSRRQGTSRTEENVADPNESRSGEGRVFRDISDEERRASETRGESIQSEDRQTRTDNIGSSSEYVADTESFSGDGGEIRQRSEESRKKREIRVEIGRVSSDKQKLADTNSERLEGFRESSRQFSKTFFATDSSEEQQRTMDQGWWSVEPNVGRVAHGVSGRVHRLKALGNSIVPQIAEEIGRAIIKAESKE